MITVSVITINYKEAELTKKCVEKLLRSQKIQLEIIVIDNSCDLTEQKILKEIDDQRVKLYIKRKNSGCVDGYNFGIKKARGKYIFIVNNDTEINDVDSLNKMVRFLDGNKDIAVIQPKIKSLVRPDYFEYAGASGGYLDKLGYPFCRGRIFQTVEKDNGQYDKITEITWASTCAFFARRKILLKAGLFDPIYFAYAEEVDMCLKIWNLGYRIVSFPQTTIYHRGETAWKKTRGKKTYLIHRNHLILYFKCFSFKQIIFLLPQRLFLEVTSMFSYLFNNSIWHIIFVLRSYLSVIFLWRAIIKKRKQFFKDYQSDRKPIFNRSIVMEHFFYKKKYFNQLGQDKFYHEEY